MDHKGAKFGLALIISGPSGTGKSTVCDLVRERYPGLQFSISCTTRSPRGGEVDGKEYHFLSKDEFAAKVADNQFIEHATVHGNSYGTLRSEIFDRVNKGEDVLLDIDVQGAMQINEYIKNDPVLAKCIKSLFIAPPSFAVLENRLRSRATDSPEAISVRLKNAKDELEKQDEYDFVIINNELDKAVDDMENLINSLRNSS
jgi:guanylate kinase